MEPFARRARAVASIAVPLDLTVAAVRILLTDPCFDQHLATATETYAATATHLAPQLAAVLDAVDAVITLANDGQATVPDAAVATLAARKVFLPCGVALGLISKTAVQSAAAATPEARCRAIAKAFLSAAGPTTNLAVAVRNANAKEPKLPDGVREQLATQLIERVQHWQRCEPAALRLVTEGVQATQADDFFASAYACSAYRRMCASLAAPQVAAVLFRDLQLRPSLHEVECCLLDEVFVFAKRPGDGMKRQRE